MTTGDGKVDAGWVSQSVLARIKGVSKQAINKRVRRFVDDGLIELDARGRLRLEDWERVAEDVTDPSRLIARATTAAADEEVPAAAKADGSYAREKAKGAQLDNELKQIALDKERGSLLALDEVTEAMARCAEVMVREIDQLPGRADDLATALSRGGVDGVRQALKSVARDMRDQLARNMRLLATEDDMGEDDMDRDGGPDEETAA